MPFVKFAIAVTSCAVFACAYATSNIDTTPAWNGSSYATSFGIPDTATYGQTFTTTTTNNFLTSFSFFLSNFHDVSSNLADISFYAGVGIWDGSKIGSRVWETLMIGSVNPVSYNGFLERPIYVGAQLAPNTQYVAYFSAAGLLEQYRYPWDYPSNPIQGTNTWGYINGDAYQGGNFVWLNSFGVNDYSQLTSSAWSSPAQWGHPNDDLAFRINFLQPVPEPETYVLMLAGLSLLGIVARRRKLQGVR